MQLNNKLGLIESLQVSVLGNIPEGDFTLNGKYFMIKNNTEEEIKCRILPVNNTKDDYVETILYVGYNPILVKAIKDAPAGLQYCY